MLQSLLAINYWAPAVPAIRMKAYNFAPQVFTSHPWNAIPDLNIGLYPMAIGLAYLVPGDVSFSCWFFSVLMRLTYVGGALFGITAGGPGMGAVPVPRAAGGRRVGLCFAVIVLWGARKHWGTVAGMISDRRGASTRGLALMAAGCLTLCVLLMTATGGPRGVLRGRGAGLCGKPVTGARVRAEAGGQWTFPLPRVLDPQPRDERRARNGRDERAGDGLRRAFRPHPQRHPRSVAALSDGGAGDCGQVRHLVAHDAGVGGNRHADGHRAGMVVHAERAALAGRRDGKRRTTTL